MGLQDELQAFKSKVLAGLPHETIQIIVKATEELAATGIADMALAKGDLLPPFSLPNVHGQTVTSTKLLARGPQVMSFYRGSW